MVPNSSSQQASNRPQKHIPDEIWLAALSDPSLDWRDLKAASRVCKKFHQLFQSPIFDLAFFRDAPSASPFTEGQKLKLHPVLHETYACGSTLENCIIFEQGDKHGEIQTATLACAHDHATSPAVKTLTIYVMGNGRRLTDPNGVRVLQVLKGVVAILGARIPVNFNDVPEWETEQYKDGTIPFLATLGDHNAWAGWYEPKVDSQGKATLSAYWFDS